MLMIKLVPHFIPFIGRMHSFGDKNKEADLLVIRGFFIGVYVPSSESKFSKAVKMYCDDDFTYHHLVRRAVKKESSKCRARHRTYRDDEVNMYRNNWENSLSENHELRKKIHTLQETIKGLDIIAKENNHDGAH